MPKALFNNNDNLAKEIPEEKKQVNTGNGIGWGAIGSIAGEVFNALPNWYNIENGQSQKINNAIYGDSTADPLVRLFSGHGSDMNNALAEIQANNIDYSDIENNNNLVNTWDANALQEDTGYNFGWSNIADNLTASGKGAAAGMSIGGPWGALIGGVAGALANWGSQIGGSSRATKINKAIERANKTQIDNFYTTAQNNQKRQQRQAMMNYFADGGLLNEFNTGDSHENNPLGGIPQGIASDGLPNLVEEGEVRSDFDDAKIFNNQEKNYIITEKDCEKYLLPKSVIGCNPAEAIKKLKKEYEDRVNDPVSVATMKEWDNRVFTFQEDKTAELDEKRMKKAVKDMSDEEKAALLSSLEQPVEQQEGIDLGQPMYAKGGKIHIKPENRGKFTALKKRTGKSASWFKAHGTPAQKKMATFALNAKKWKHEDGGHLFVDGGSYGKYHPTGYLLDYDPKEEFIEYIPKLTSNSEPIVLNYDPSVLDTAINDVKKKEFGDMTDEQVDTYLAAAKRKEATNVGFDSSLLRYAPVLGSAEAMLRAAFQPKDYTLANQLREIGSQYNPIGGQHISGYRKYTPYDVNLGDVENLALEAAALRANRGQNRATQTAANIATINAFQKAKAQRNLAVQQANEANRLAVDQYNLGIDQFNAQRDTQYDQLNQQILNNRLNMMARAAAAEDASKEAWANMYNSTRENFFNQLGNVGVDTWNRNQRDALLNALGAEGIKELLKNADGRAWLYSMGYKG